MFADILYTVLIVWLALMSVMLFGMMGIDKHCARKNKRRIPERRLFAFAILGGAVGGWLGMRIFRHKTRHWYFRLGFPVLSLAQIAGALYVWRLI